VKAYERETETEMQHICNVLDARVGWVFEEGWKIDLISSYHKLLENQA
jgi:hypothetical protein